jgi:hypothetical protein
LYRAIVGSPFAQVPSVDGTPKEKNGRLENHPAGEAPRIEEEKFKLFKSLLSRKRLMEVTQSQQFFQIFQDIFAAKYDNLNHESCSHNLLVSYFIKSFDVPEGNSPAPDCQQSSENVNRLESLYNSIQKLKGDISSCHKDIANMSNHIQDSLFKNGSSEN